MRFVDAFFQYAYSSNPFIHKASFNVNTASRYLVLAVLLFGLTYASPENASAYNEYFNVVEFLIFEGPEFQQLLRQKENPVISKEIIQLIQAAILVIELQGSKSDVEIKRRTRVQRLPVLISMARMLNLTKVVNDIVLNGRTASLEEFLHKETLVRLVMPYISMCSRDLLMKDVGLRRGFIFLTPTASYFTTRLLSLGSLKQGSASPCTTLYSTQSTQLKQAMFL